MATLAELSPGEGAYVKSLCLFGTLRERLEDLGLVEGTFVRCRLMAPSGSPLAFRIRGAVIALRRQDAAQILCIPEGST